MSKETFYFSHDYNARADDKIKRLIRTHGMVGYGIFWTIVEDLYNNANALKTDYEGIAFDLRADSEIVKSIINDFDLFVFENGSFGSVSIEHRLDERNLKSEKARQSAFKRWDKIKADANAMQSHSEGNAIKDSIVKESKGKGTIPPPVFLIAKYCEERNNGIDANYFYDWYQTRGWKVGKDKMKDWQSAIRTWERRNKKPESKLMMP